MKIVFILGCIICRAIIAYGMSYIPTRFLPYMGTITMIPFIGFSYIYLNDLRKVGLETGGKEIWWNDMRPVHGAIYYMFSIMALKSNKHAYLALVLDVIVAIFVFIYHYYIIHSSR